MIDVRGPRGWEDISLRADQDLAVDVASRRYRQRVAEQEARACMMLACVSIRHQQAPGAMPGALYSGAIGDITGTEPNAAG